MGNPSSQDQDSSRQAQQDKRRQDEQKSNDRVSGGNQPSPQGPEVGRQPDETQEQKRKREQQERDADPTKVRPGGGSQPPEVERKSGDR